VAAGLIVLLTVALVMGMV